MNTTTPWTLHPQLAADSAAIADLPLCALRLIDDAQYPWCLLIPRRAGLREIFELSVPDQQQLLCESSALAQTMARLFAADKMNVAALGNMVPQLHVHHIARRIGDPAWPAPVWGRHPAQAYPPAQRAERVAALRAALMPHFDGS